MAVRVAYGKKTGINAAISNGTIPKDSIIITKDGVEAELLFYDSDGNLKNIAERTRFTSIQEAEKWINDYPCDGLVLTIYNGTNWKPYVVNNKQLSEISDNIIDMTQVKIIDGGTFDN